MNKDNNYEEKIIIGDTEVNIVDNQALSDDALEDVNGGLSMRDVKGVVVAASLIGAGIASSTLPVFTTVVKADNDVTITTDAGSTTTQTTTDAGSTTTQTTTETGSTKTSKKDNNSLDKDIQKDVDKAAKKAEEKMGVLIAKAVKGEVNETAFLEQTTKIANDTLIRAIPYIGPFISAYNSEIRGWNDKPDTDKRMLTTLTEINSNLKEINNNIIISTDRVVSQSIREQISKKVVAINSRYKTLNDCYNSRNTTRKKAIAKYYNQEELKNAEIVVLKNTYKYSPLKNEANMEYYEAFLDFSDAITGKVFIGGYDDHGDNMNIFEINALVSNTNHGSNLSAIPERIAFINETMRYYENAMFDLETAMNYDKSKYELFVNAMNNNGLIDELRATAKDVTTDKATKERIEMLIEQYDEYESNLAEIYNNINTIHEKQERVNDCYEIAVNKILEEENADTYVKYTKEGKAETVKKDWSADFKDYKDVDVDLHKFIMTGAKSVKAVQDFKCEKRELVYINDEFMNDKTVKNKKGKALEAVLEKNDYGSIYLSEKDTSNKVKKDTFSGHTKIYYFTEGSTYTKAEVSFIKSDNTYQAEWEWSKLTSKYRHMHALMIRMYKADGSSNIYLLNGMSGVVFSGSNIYEEGMGMRSDVKCYSVDIENNAQFIGTKQITDIKL